MNAALDARAWEASEHPETMVRAVIGEELDREHARARLDERTALVAAADTTSRDRAGVQMRRAALAFVAVVAALAGLVVLL